MAASVGVVATEAVDVATVAGTTTVAAGDGATVGIAAEAGAAVAGAVDDGRGWQPAASAITTMRNNRILFILN
jgi:hypothetical protein